MNWRYEYTPYIWPAIASTVFTIVLAVYGWRRRSVPGAFPFGALMVCGALWALGSGLELASTDLAGKIFWVKFQSAWQLPMVTAGVWFAFEYADLRRLLVRRNFILLAVPPFLWLLLILTNDAHNLIWSGFSFQGSVRPERNTATWIFMAYGLLLGLAPILVFVWLFWRSPLHRIPVALCLCGQVAARAAYGLKVAGAIPAVPVDPVVLSFDFAAVMFALALFRFRLFNLIPIARGTVIDQMREGMLVLDGEGRIMDLNAAAERILGVSAAHAKGRDVIQLLPELSEMTELLSFPGKTNSETSLRIGDSSYYSLHLSSLVGRHGHPLGSLILFHDITEQASAQAQLVEQQRALATLQERERVARELHDSIGQVLGYVKMQSQAARLLLARNRITEADCQLAQLVAATQDAHADVREYILGARSDASSPFVPALEGFLRRFSEHYGIDARLSVEPGFSEEMFEPMVQAQLLRIIQEALTNVRKHSRAGGVSVRLGVTDSCGEATVRDDGVGFDLQVLESDEGQRFGLHFMRERAQEVGGSVDFRSEPGEGATVTVRVPARKDHS